MSEKKKICFVIQRYGLEVNGGAEAYCRELAEKLLDRYDVSVFTTKAIDYMSWNNEYQKDQETINGVRVYRYPVDHPRRRAVFDEINGRFLSGKWEGPAEENEWFEQQGPYTPKLLDALRAHRDEYDVFIMCTYLYYQTVYGLEIVRDKAILIPMTHDEPFLRFEKIKSLFRQAQNFIYLTEEEQLLVESRMEVAGKPCVVAGAGVDLPQNIDAARFREKYALGDAPYIVYVGRVDEGKGCGVMFRYWDAYKKRNPSPLKLVLMGKPVIPVPQRDDLLSLGFVSEQDKFDGEAGARFLLLPSPFESLSIVVLESMLLGVPVLVNGKCEVLKGHCRKSNAGLYYENYLEFEGAMNLLQKRKDVYAAMCQNAPEYVQKYYRWSVILAQLGALIDQVAAQEVKK